HCEDCDNAHGGDHNPCTVNDRCIGEVCSGDPIQILSITAQVQGNPTWVTSTNQEIQFSAYATTPNCPEGLVYEWDFADGSPKAHVPTTKHTYTTPGNYIVKVTASCPVCPSARKETALLL